VGGWEEIGERCGGSGYRLGWFQVIPPGVIRIGLSIERLVKSG